MLCIRVGKRLVFLSVTWNPALLPLCQHQGTRVPESEGPSTIRVGMSAVE